MNTTDRVLCFIVGMSLAAAGNLLVGDLPVWKNTLVYVLFAMSGVLLWRSWGDE